MIRKVRRSSKNNEKRKLKKQRALLDKGKITARQSNSLTEAGGATQKRATATTLSEKPTKMFKRLFPESKLLCRKNTRPEKESYFCGFIVDPREMREMFSEK